MVLAVGLTSPKLIVFPFTVAFCNPSALIPRRPVNEAFVCVIQLPLIDAPVTLNNTIAVAAFCWILSILLLLIVQLVALGTPP